MLVSFSVSNFRSFGDEETLNMIASNKLSDHPSHRIDLPGTDKGILRSAVIYGANAAGKSNLVRAMSFAQQCIVRGSERPVVAEPFRFGRDETGTPSSFEFRFLIGDHVFAYGFDVTHKTIVSEWLTVRVRDDDVVIFERDNSGATRIGDGVQRVFPADPIMKSTLDDLQRLPLRGHQLFLSRVKSIPDESQGETLRSVIRWLTQDLVILRPDHQTFDIVDQLAGDDEFCQFVAEFLRNVGTGVCGIRVEEMERKASDWERNFIKRSGAASQSLSRFRFGSDDTDIRVKEDDPDLVVERRLVADHDSTTADMSLPFGEESDGTRQLLHFIPFLAAASDASKVVVIDELDRSLHPLICWEFIRFFSETSLLSRKQLIVTTHEAHLLNQELLRRDEYWFVEKDTKQQSRLVPLSEFKARKDLQLERGYLQGRFGAIPMIGSMSELENLLEAQQQERMNATQDTAN